MSSLTCKDYVYKMQSDRFEVFRDQNPENGNFDVKFDIQGKILYANRFILTPVSGTLDAWLSDRWSNKDEPIKIESYNYDNFFEFLSFIYNGNCKLTNENIREMVDLAEFYAVPCLKDFCDDFLSKMRYPYESIEEWYDFAQQYSLPFFTESIKNFIYEKGDRIIIENDFSSFKKPFVQFFSAALDGGFMEEFFEAAYKWSEHHIMKQETSAANDGNVDIQEAIKAELSTIIPDPDFYKMDFKFLMDFVVEHEFFVSPSHYFFTEKYTSQETSFKWTYELAEKQALKKQSIAAKNGENFDVAALIQSDLAEVIPHVEFYKMSYDFLLNFALEKGYLLSAADLLNFYNRFTYVEEQMKFERVYDLAEKQALKKKAISTTSDGFNLVDSIKAELIEVIPHVKFCKMDFDFLMDFVLEKEFLLSPKTLSDFFTFLPYSEDGQNFQNVYEIAEKQALFKKKMSFDHDNFNLDTSIKADMAEVMPHVKYYRYNKEFLHDFVVAHGFISEEDANRVYDTRVQVKNYNQVITGVFTDVYGIRRKFDCYETQRTVRNSAKKRRFCKVKILIPETPSTVMKMKGVDWYLCLEKDGVFTVKHHSIIARNDYLIAELGSNDNFQIHDHITINFSDNF